MRIHSGIEAFLRHEAELPEDASSLASKYQTLRDLGPLRIEEDWAFDPNWKPVDWNSPDAYCRMKLDAFYAKGQDCKIVDHKTGKQYDLKHVQQGQLYSIGALAKEPDLVRFNVEFYYTDLGKTKNYNFHKKQIQKFQDSFDRRAAKLQNDTAYKPVSNPFNCKYCAYGNNGTQVCEYRSDE